MNIFQSFRYWPPVTKNILLINLIIWAFLNIALHFSPSAYSAAENILALHYFSSPHFNPVQLVTYMFMQVDFLHLFFNMFAVFMFGMTLERVMGSKRFLFYYISCGLGAALIQLGVFAIMIAKEQAALPAAELPLIMDTIKTQGADIIARGMNYADPIIGAINSYINTPVIGASGCVFGVLLAFGFLFPRQPLYLFFIPVPIQARWFVIGYGAIELMQGLANNPGDNVAHFAHLGGMLIGFIILLIWKKRGIFGGPRY